MTAVNWTLDIDAGRITLARGTNWDDAALRKEVRADATILANQLGRPITIIDLDDPISGRVAEVVSPTRKLIPDLPVDHDEPGITRGRVMR